MGKKEKFGFGFITIVALSYFIYHIGHIQKKPKNLFLENEAEVKSFGNELNEEKVFKLNGHTFHFSELPDSLQKQIRNNQIIAHEKINSLLKDYAISYFLATVENPGKDIDPKKLPKIKMAAEIKTDLKMIEEIYQKNKDKFPKDHNPEQVKTDLAVKVMGAKVEGFLKQNLKKMYKNNSLVLPEYPQLPEDWFKTGITQDLGDLKAKNHLIWIGTYVDPKSEEIKENIGKLVKKYSLTDFRLSFIPSSNAVWDFSQALNIRVLCMKMLYGIDSFWRFHTQLLKYGTKFLKVNPKDIGQAAQYTTKILTTLGYKPKELDALEACADNKKKDNPLLDKIIKIEKKLEFIPDTDLPIFIFNGRYLDLSGRTLFEAVNSQIKEKENKEP